VAIIAVSMVYLVVTVSAMLIYVAVALEGVKKFNFQFIEKNEKGVIGVVLILVGVATYFFNLH
jgi:hypothetical protein